MSIDLIGGVLSGVLGTRRKRSGKALRFLTGNRGGLLSNPSTLLAAAGVAWGIFDALQNRTGASAGSLPTPAPAAGPTPASARGGSTVPPIPGSAVAPNAPPPLPDVTGVSDDVLRLIRLAISAAHADGAMTERERAALLQQAKASGAADIIEQELGRPRPLAAVVSGVSDPAQAATLYVLAFTIVRADEQVSGPERIYLAQLANLLGLEPSLVQTLERNTGERIDALGDQGQLGG